MVSIRYHLVTLVAVFLALGIGVVVGSTVIDKALVDDLERRVDDLDKALTNAQQVNDKNQSQIDALEDLDQRLAEQGPAALLNGDLADTPVLLVAVDGIETGPVDDLADTVVAAGGRYQGTLWLNERLALADEDATTALGELLGGAGGDAEALRERLYQELGAELGAVAAEEPLAVVDGEEPSTVTTNTADTTDTTTAAASADGADAPAVDSELVALLEGLDDDGFVRLDDRPDPDQRTLAGVRIVVVSGAGAKLADDAFVYPLLGALAGDSDATVVAAESWAPPPGADDGTPAADPGRGVFVGRVRDDRPLRERISTVDDLELFAGRAAVVLALHGTAAGVVGHYGIGDGADALLPSP
jgi:Copper transport outer membrane protein, MctB